jgi:glycerol-3-phosphate acyltransferase PlsY
MPVIDDSAATLALWTLIGYLLGSIPFGVVLTRTFGLGDLRAIGSGSIGATNVLRTGSRGAALATLILDALKGVAAVLLARAAAGEDAAQLAAFAAMVGHCYPVWLRFNGGKGVATFLGLLLALAWAVGLVACAAWLVGAAIWRISSVGSLLAAAVSGVAALILGEGQMLVLCLALALLVFWRHRSNIARLRAGTEPRIGQKT